MILKKIAISLILLFLSLLTFAQGNSPLIDLIENGDYKKAETLIRNKKHINKRDSNGATAFMWAIYKNQLDLVKLLKKNGANIKAKGLITDDDEELVIGSPLTVAAFKGDLEIVKFLVQDCRISANDKEIDGNGKYAWTAMFYLAYRNDFKEIADFLIKNGADYNLKDSNGMTPLSYAFKQIEYVDNNNYIKYLLNKKATSIFIDVEGITPASFAIYCHQTEKAKKILKNDKTLINKSNKPLANPLTVAIIQEDEAMVKWLLENGADKKIALKFITTIFKNVSEQENYGAYNLIKKYLLDGNLVNNNLISSKVYDTIITTTAKPEFFNFLLNNGFTIKKDGKNLYPKYFYTADINKKIRIIEEHNMAINADTLSSKLIAKTINKNRFNFKVFDHLIKTSKNDTIVYNQILEAAIDHHNEFAFNLILDKKINLNAKLYSNSSFLWMAYKADNLLMFKKLIDAGADINYNYKNGETILHRMASNRSCNHTDFIKTALQKGADINAKNNNGDTAIKLSSKNCIDYILTKYKADFSIKNKENESALDDLYYYSSDLFYYSHDKDHLADLFIGALKYNFSSNNVDHHILKYILKQGINLKDSETVEKINHAIISLVKSSDHFNQFNTLLTTLKEYDSSYKAPNIDALLIEKITKDSKITKAITKAIINNNLSDFKKELDYNNLANAKYNSDEYLIFLTVAAQYDSREIVLYILKQGINPLNRKIVPYSNSSYKKVDGLQTLVDKKNTDAIKYIISVENETNSYDFLNNYEILCGLKDEALLKFFMEKNIKENPHLKKPLKYHSNQNKLNYSAVKNNLLGFVKYLSEQEMDVALGIRPCVNCNMDINEILIIEEKLDFIKFYIEKSKDEEFMFIIEDQLEYIILKNKTELIDLFAPYILENKNALSLYYKYTMKYDNTYAMDVMLKLHPKEKYGTLKSHIKYAIETRNHNFISTYYNNGFDINIKLQSKGGTYNYRSDQGLIEYAINSNTPDMIDFLIDCGVTINDPANNKDSPVEYAASTYNINLLTSILNTGVSPDIYNNYSEKPWSQKFINTGFYNGFETLWKRNINPNLLSSSKKNLLHCMVHTDYNFIENNINILDKISNINAKTNEGETALFMASKTGNITIAKAILSKKADTNIPNHKKVMPLMMAAYTNNEALVKLLLQAKANKKSKDDKDRTALDYATMGNATIAIKNLLKEE